MTTKKLIILAIIVIGLAAGSYLIYHFFFTQKLTDNSAGNQILITPAVTQSVFPLSKEKVLSPSIDETKQKIKYYSKENGNIYQVNFNGSELSKISAANLAGIINLIWSPDKEKVLGTFQQDSGIKRYLHDYQSGKDTLLNDSIGQAAWSPDGGKITVQSYDSATGTNTVSVANADGSDLKGIFQTRLKDMVLEWPTVDKISIKTPVSGLSDGLVLTVNPEDGTFKKIINGLFGLNVKWSPLGDKFIYSTTSSDGKNLNLFTAGQSGENSRALGISTLVEKCVFSQDDRTIFCGIPQKLSENAVWPDDYYKGLTSVSDQIFKINLDTGEKSLLFSPNPAEKSYDTSDLFLSPQEDYLFFINRKDGMLYGLKVE
jgi:Tol biopolymer transport system component